MISCCTTIIFKKKSLAIKTVREQRYTKDRIVYDSVWRHRQFAGLYERNNRYIPVPEYAHSLSRQAPGAPPMEGARSGILLFFFSGVVLFFCLAPIPVYLFTLATESSCHDNLAIDRP